MITNLSATQLRRAADIKDKIESLQGELGQLLDSRAQAGSAPRRQYKMSAAGRARIAAAARARWAKVKGKKSASPTKSKRKMSAAARAKIAAAAKARWAKAKAQGKKSLRGA
ncbi:MAG TPA: hypothetical protein VMB22_05435 [Verrucomicrobiae bacterium]|nr:hypothetical protein [Verrucomicrobiae bacterium]